MRTKVITNSDYNKSDYTHHGNMFLTGNGAIGVRGTLCEYREEYMPAINLGGVYDRVGDGWREPVNAPNGLFAELTVDGEKLTLPDSKYSEHSVRLNIYDGIYERKTCFAAAKGSVTLSEERMVSQANPNLILQCLTVQTERAAEICVHTEIDGDVWDINGPHLEQMVCDYEDGVCFVSAVTHEKGTHIATFETAEYEFPASENIAVGEKIIARNLCFTTEAGKEYKIYRKILVTAGETKDTSALGSCAEEKAKHIAKWHAVWDTSYIEIDGDEAAERALNYSIYHLNCIAPRHSESMSIAARGLSGQVYKGAVFWDTEMFMLDYYLYTEPKIARTLVKYRIDTLDGAKEKAKSYGWDGAFYAWESQEGGYDACSDYNVVDVFTKRPMRTFFKDKQVHISAAVVYALDKYVRITGDTSVLDEGGYDVLRECAKFYRSLLLKKINSDSYEIHDVIGPDEYHERVNNNAYTNAMARFVFRTAAKYLNKPEYAELAERVYLPKADENGVIEQFDGYFALEDCSVDEVRGRLLDEKEYWGGAYGVASHTQVIKQADVVAMLAMLPEEFSDETKKANLKFYEPRTEHGSSLSACMYSLLSCKTGDAEFAYPFFMKSAEADLHSGGKEWAGLIYIGGTHPASEGGAWMVAVFGFAGLEINDGEIVCNPHLPKAWKSMKFKINYKGDIYQIAINGSDWSVTKQ